MVTNSDDWSSSAIAIESPALEKSGFPGIKPRGRYLPGIHL